MKHSNKTVLVLGAGVSGLSTAVLLLKAGFTVELWAKAQSPNTTSDMAAAIWYPYLCNPRDKALVWSKATLQYLRDHTLDDPTSGCREEELIELFETKVDDPWWQGAASYTHAQPDQLPAGYHDGYRITSILTDPTLYLDWLQNQVIAAGGVIKQKTVSDIQEAFAHSPIVINCTGLGSRELFGDNEVYPVRGQVVRVKSNGLDHGLVDQHGRNSLAYIIPRMNEIVLGGTAQENNWDLTPDPQVTEDILRKARALSPLFEDVEIIGVGVGLRPARSEVRLEVEKFGDNHVVHNYGHGGSGFTLSWGCASDVVQLVKKLT